MLLYNKVKLLDYILRIQKSQYGKHLDKCTVIVYNKVKLLDYIGITKENEKKRLLFSQPTQDIILNQQAEIFIRAPTLASF